MRSKRELFDIASAMDCDKDYESFYEFCKNFLSNPNVPPEDAAERLKVTLKNFEDNYRSEASKVMLGITGNHKAEIIKSWCGMVLRDNTLWELDKEELCFVMGICAHRATINKNI